MARRLPDRSARLRGCPALARSRSLPRAAPSPHAANRAAPCHPPRIASTLHFALYAASTVPCRMCRAHPVSAVVYQAVWRVGNAELSVGGVPPAELFSARVRGLAALRQRCPRCSTADAREPTRHIQPLLPRHVVNL